MQPDRKKLVVLISGSGSNLQAIIDACQQDARQAEVVAVISNCPSAYGLTRAEKAGIPALVLDHRQFTERAIFDLHLRDMIDIWQPDIVALAGFMRILTPQLVDHYAGRMINIHPSLLPHYPGLHTHRRVLEAGDKEHGATVHFVTPELDGGPAIVQARVPVNSADTETTLAEKVITREHIIYPLAIKWLGSGRLRLDANRALLDDAPLPLGGFQWREDSIVVSQN